MSERKISMVDIGKKEIVKRIATAAGKIYLKKETIALIKKGAIKKGDPIQVGQVAALIAIKQVPTLIPLCHQIPITNVKFDYQIEEDYIEVFVTVETLAKTGVEMEALMGVSVFLNVIWDMTKYLEKDKKGQYPTTQISDIRVLKKAKIDLR